MAGLERGEPIALVLLGEPGIGKTRLLAELAARGDASGCVVLAGSASELELDLPFWPFVDALDEYAAGLDPRRLASVEDEVRVELARVFPSLSDFADGGRPALQDERYRAHRAVRELLERLAATKPLVLLRDDVHWADSASVELLGALLRRPPAAAVLLAMGARPRQLPERLASALERASRAGSLVRLELGGLERDEAAELLGEGVDDALADEFYKESGGNPFYLEQLARSTRLADGALMSGAQHPLAGIDVPAAVAAVLSGELGLLSTPTRPRFVRPPAPRGGSAPRCACCPIARCPSSGSSCCWRAPRPSGLRDGSTRAARTSSRASRSCRTSWSRSASGSRSLVPASSTCSVATRSLVPASWPPWTGSRMPPRPRRSN